MEKADKVIHYIEKILDPGSFFEIGAAVKNHDFTAGRKESCIDRDGVVTGSGKIAGKDVYLYMQDSAAKGGTLGLNHGRKIARVIELAMKNRCPVIGISDSGGARIQEGVNALAGYGEVFRYNTLASGYIPQIAVIAGNCAGGAVYSPALTDFVFVIEKQSLMYLTGPAVVKEAVGEQISAEELGGAQVHAQLTGAAHVLCRDLNDCAKKIVRLMQLLCQAEDQKKSIRAGCKCCSKIAKPDIPRESRSVYDIRKVILDLADDDSFFEIQEKYAPNLVTGFARIDGIVIGVVGNQPLHMGGVLDTKASCKGASFVRFCDAYDIPVLTLVDVPGFLPGSSQEHTGVIRHGAKLVHAYAEATTVKITVILRKAYGGAYIAMGSRHLGADAVYAWPAAEVAVMGAEGAVSILYKKQVRGMDEEAKYTYLREKAGQYREDYLGPEKALQEGYIDGLIKPEETRDRIIADLERMSGKQEFIHITKKHSCIPL